MDEQSQRLRAAVLALRSPQAAKRAPAPTSSVYGRAAAAVPGDVHTAATREMLAVRFRNVETTALMSGTSLVLAVLPDRGEPPPSLMRSMQLLVSAGAVVVLLGEDIPRSIDRSRPLTLPLRAGDALSSEWALLACGPSKRAAFLARRQPDDSWCWLMTRDPVAVHRAGTGILERVPFLNVRVPLLEEPPR